MKRINAQTHHKISKLKEEEKNLKEQLESEKIKNTLLGQQLVQANLDLISEKQKSIVLGNQLTESMIQVSIEKEKTKTIGQQLTSLRLELVEKGVI